MRDPVKASDTEVHLAEYTCNGTTKQVLRYGSAGPAILVIHEIYGFTETLDRFCRWIYAAGFQVYAPILFGRPDTSNPEAQSLGRIAALCISREFNLFAANRSSPVVDWLKALARQALAECGGRGVGAIGMCVTGGFALAMAVDPVVLAPVLAQPGAPALSPRALDISRIDLGTVRARVAQDGLRVRGYRFEGDTICQAGRFKTLKQELGEGFEAYTLPDAAANPYSPMAKAKKPPHSVFTGDLVDVPDNPTRQAVDDVIAFFRDRLV